MKWVSSFVSNFHLADAWIPVQMRSNVIYNVSIIVYFINRNGKSRKKFFFFLIIVARGVCYLRWISIISVEREKEGGREKEAKKNIRLYETFGFCSLPNHQTCTYLLFFTFSRFRLVKNSSSLPSLVSLVSTRPTESFNHAREFMRNQTENKIGCASSRGYEGGEREKKCFVSEKWSLNSTRLWNKEWKRN